MNFVILETNRMWEDREGTGHNLPDRAMTFWETARLKEIWEWVQSDGTGEPRGTIKIIKQEDI